MMQIAHTKLTVQEGPHQIRACAGFPAGATLDGPASQPLKTRAAETGELRDLANLSWPERPLNLMAADVMDLEGQGTMKTLAAMMELTHYLGRDAFDILHLEDMVAGKTEASLSEHIYLLQSLVLRTARTSGITAAKVTVDRAGAHHHMRVRLHTRN
ncbi:hypothetical protein [Ovoidimarina sediminis]|uniref:hypothetical protein n=1 Tax=Ovoidimarina sediminis TaxID=3079856 RepID=UPI002913B6F8|nr:hypothetical protein [Rhodophyticola sp. MJ-SS7]MDU8946036.1 hypothetical protein [Rhodophyticola sp. MJ-SS7]